MYLLGDVPGTDLHERGLGDAMIALAAVIVPLATGVAYWTGVRLANEVGYVIDELRALAAGDRVEPIPVRTLDEVGALTRRFEDLRQHWMMALSQEEEAKRRAEAADFFRAEFLTSLSHELRTPLNAILGFADVLLTEIDGPLSDAQREDIEIIRSAGQHLLDLFNDVLDLSAAASGSLTINRVQVDLESTLEFVVRTLKGEVQTSAVHLSLEVEGALPALVGDDVRLKQVFTNLVGNAVKFTERGEVRVVAMAAPDGGIVVEVIDTGVGIEPADVDVIFDEFHQTGDQERRTRGTGLGLSIARHLVELHEGQISVTSVMGEGSTFRVYLPGAAR